MTESPKPSARCPICGKPSIEEFRPFCSARCKDIDLHRWLTGAYVIPGPPLTEDDEDDETTPPGDRDDDEN